MKRLAYVLFVLFLAVIFVGCGGKSEEDQIIADMEAAMSEKDPAKQKEKMEAIDKRVKALPKEKQEALQKRQMELLKKALEKAFGK
jgi:hypothetical protein